jgi:hypothetical protein
MLLLLQEKCVCQLSTTDLACTTINQQVFNWRRDVQPRRASRLNLRRTCAESRTRSYCTEAIATTNSICKGPNSLSSITRLTCRSTRNIKLVRHERLRCSALPGLHPRVNMTRSSAAGCSARRCSAFHQFSVFFAVIVTACIGAAASVALPASAAEAAAAAVQEPAETPAAGVRRPKPEPPGYAKGCSPPGVPAQSLETAGSGLTSTGHSI